MMLMGDSDVKTPILTVVMPIYNAGHFLRQAVFSVLNQTVDDWELIIIDDGSTDGSLETIARCVDPRIRIVADGLNKGLACRLNECIDLAQGQFIARMDQDDVSFPGRFERQLSELLADPDLDLIATRAMIIDEKNVPIGMFPFRESHSSICSEPWRGFYMPHPAWMGRTEWFRKFRYANPGPYMCEDQELLLRAYGSSKFRNIDVVLFAYRKRTKMDWKKLEKTRYTLAKTQYQYFAKKKKFWYAVLALISFGLRRLHDYFDMVFCDLKSNPILLDSALTKDWSNLLSDLTCYD